MSPIVHRDRAEMGRAVGARAAAALRDALRTNPVATLVVATGASQFEVLAALAQAAGLDWSRVEIFHLDEYLGVGADHPASFRHYLQQRLLSRLPTAPRAFHAIDGQADPDRECIRLAGRVPNHTFDVALIGIGENGHLAFNDPPADFETSAPFLVVGLDEACRRQQVREGWFPALEEVPSQAITMSIRRILASRRIFCSVPDSQKAAAVRGAIEGPLTPDVPASILRIHPGVELHLDRASASGLYTLTAFDETPEAFSGNGGVPLDLQLNGYQGVDFNADELTLDELRRIGETRARSGEGEILATVITDELDRMLTRIGRLAKFHSEDALVRHFVRGIHVEGPFIDPAPGFCGAHPDRFALPATVEVAARIVDAGEGLVRTLTLAPEHDAGMRTIRWLTEQRILVSAGHCDPSSETLARAVDAGLRAFTHLGNGCPSILPRHDNIIQRVLACQSLPFVMFIADGVHVPVEALSNYIRLVGTDRAIAVTDGTSAAGMGPGRFPLAGQEVEVGADGIAWSRDRSHFVGSTATMTQIRKVLQDGVGLTASEVEQLVVINPRRALSI